MKSRIFGIVAAIVLALIGTIALVAYVNGADQRAYGGAQMKTVYIIKQSVPAKTPGGSLKEHIRKETLPAAAIANGAVTDLADLVGKVAAVKLEPGEQLLASRFVNQSELQAVGTVAVPKGMQEVSVQLAPERLIGGQVKAGDTVGVFVSFDDGPGKAGPTTHLLFHKVLVTSIQGAPAAASADSEAPETGPTVPAGALIITLARNSRDAENIVFATEFGKIWLSKQSPKATEKGTRILKLERFYR